MRLEVRVPDDGRVHRFCVRCRAEAVHWVRIEGRSRYDCSACGGRSDRALVVDPAVTWWVDEEREYWHESAGVFLRRRDGRVLFFRRTDFPVRWTAPSGHVDVGEAAVSAAARELREEVGVALDPSVLTHLGTEDIVGDSCRRGADAHRWHAYLGELDDPGVVEVLEEGECPQWLTLDEALARSLSVPVRHMILHARSAGLV